MKKLILLFFIFLNALNTKAQKTNNFITIEYYNALVSGVHPNLSLIAETNNYPSPSNVLKLEKQIKLESHQKKQLIDIETELLRKSKEMGNFIINQYNKLNTLFETNKIQEGNLIFATNKIGALEGELQNAYLNAHLQTRKILTQNQLKKYIDLSKDFK